MSAGLVLGLSPKLITGDYCRVTIVSVQINDNGQARLVYDTTSGKEVASLDIVGDTDDLFYDAARKRLYVSGGEGFIDVFQQQDGNRFTRAAHLTTAPGARTSLFVPGLNRLYLAVPHRGTQKAEIRVYEARD